MPDLFDDTEADLPVLRTYQRDVHERARRQMARGLRRGIIQGETGCGKGHIIGEMCRLAALKGKRVLVLADRRRLIGQLSNVLRQFQTPHGVIMSQETHNVGCPVLLASRDTLAAWKKHDRSPPPADLIIIDEAHKSMGSTYQAILDLYPQAFVIGFTATPARSDGKSLSNFYQWLECTVPASTLIADGWLIKPEVYAPPELTAKRKSGEQVKGLAGDPVEHWRKHAEGLPTIAFCSKVAESLALVDRFQAAGIAAEHVDADTPDDKSERGRDAVYKRLAHGELLVVSSVGLLIEGVDIPEVSAAIIWTKFGSLVQWRQGCGRTMRPCERIGKTRSVILDHAGAAGVHGLPGDDVEWSLDDGSTCDSRRKKKIEAGEIAPVIYCSSCGAGYSGLPECPSCGFKAPAKKRRKADPLKAYADTNETLQRLDTGAAQPAVAAEAMDRLWWRCLGITCAKGQKLGVAAAMFSRTAGQSPWSAGVSPLPSSKEDWQRPAADVFPSFVKRKVGA